MSNPQKDQIHSNNSSAVADESFALLDLRQFLIIKNPLKMMKNAFYFMLKALFLKIFKFLSCLFGHVGKRLDNFDFKIYDVTDWTENNYNKHTAQYLEK